MLVAANGYPFSQKTIIISWLMIRSKNFQVGKHLIPWHPKEDHMRSLGILILLTQTVSFAQECSRMYTYTSYKIDPSIWERWLDDVKHPLERPYYNEVDQFDFEARIGKKLHWTCTELGDQINGEPEKKYGTAHGSNDKLLEQALKGAIVLCDKHRSEIWQRADNGPRIVCTFPLPKDQVQFFREYFKPYTSQRLELPWYEGILSETFGKFSIYWTLGKTGFDAVFGRKRSDMLTAAQMMTLVEIGGEFERVVYFDKANWNCFVLSTQYSVRVGDNPEKRHIPLYSIIFHISP